MKRFGGSMTELVDLWKYNTVFPKEFAGSAMSTIPPGIYSFWTEGGHHFAPASTGALFVVFADRPSLGAIDGICSWQEQGPYAESRVELIEIPEVACEIAISGCDSEMLPHAYVDPMDFLSDYESDLEGIFGECCMWLPENSVHKFVAWVLSLPQYDRVSGKKQPEKGLGK